MANSRPLLRRDATLVSPPLSRAADFWFRRSSRRQLPRKLRHFDSRQPRLKSFVAALEPRAIDGLLQRIARQHAKYDRQPDVHLCQLQPSRRLRTNVIVMCRRAPQHAANRNQRLIPPASRQLLRRQRQFKRTRNPDHIHVFARSPRPLQRIHCRRQQPLRNKAVEPAHHNPKPQSGRFQLPVNPLNLEFVRHSRLESRTPGLQYTRAPFLVYFLYLVNFLYFPRKSAFLFSKNAFVPSRISSVAHESPNKLASRNNPSSCGISIPRSIASIAYFTATGALAMIFFAIASAAGKSSAGSKIRFTSPIRCASSAVIISPVRQSSCAAPLPHSRASRCVPPYPGIIPNFTSGWPSFAVLLAIRIVQESASSHPPPSANPLIAQIDGFPIVSSNRSTLCPKSENSLPSTGVRVASSPMSAPATNDFSPAPVKISTRTAESSRASSSASRNSSIVFRFSAFNTFGRLKAIYAIPSFFSKTKFSKVIRYSFPTSNFEPLTSRTSSP